MPCHDALFLPGFFAASAGTCDGAACEAASQHAQRLRIAHDLLQTRTELLGCAGVDMPRGDPARLRAVAR